MPVIQLVIVLVVVGLVMWLINSLIPMQGAIKSLLNIVVLFAMILYVLAAFGIIGSVPSIRIRW